MPQVFYLCGLQSWRIDSEKYVILPLTAKRDSILLVSIIYFVGQNLFFCEIVFYDMFLFYILAYTVFQWLGYCIFKHKTKQNKKDMTDSD